MVSYTISLLPVAAQVFSAQMGDNLLTLKLQWMERTQSFRVDISDSDGVAITSGRTLAVGANLFHGLYPTPQDTVYGTLMLTGDEATVDNLGINNTLVYTDG